MSYRSVALGDVVDVLSGFAFKSEFFNNTDGVPVVRIRDVVRGFTDTYYAGPYAEQFLVRDGDILIGMDGNFNAARWRGGRALLNQRVCKVTAKESLDAGYLFHYLPIVLKKIEDATPFVTVKHLAAGDLRCETIPLPPLSEQRRITAILDKADALRSQRGESLAQLDVLAQSIFVEMFGDPVTNPRGWGKRRLGEIFEIARGGSPRPIDEYITDAPNGVNWVMIGDTELGGKYIFSTKKKIRPEGVKRSRTVRNGDFLLTNSMSFGRPYIMRTSGCIHDGWLVLSPQVDDFNADYFYTLLGSKAVFSEFSRRAAGATVKNLNIELVAGVEVAVPPLKEQRRFSAAVEAIEDMKLRHQDSAKQLACLFSSLQGQAFRGES